MVWPHTDIEEPFVHCCHDCTEAITAKVHCYGQVRPFPPVLWVPHWVFWIWLEVLQPISPCCAYHDLLIQVGKPAFSSHSEQCPWPPCRMRSSPPLQPSPLPFSPACWPHLCLRCLGGTLQGAPLIGRVLVKASVHLDFMYQCRWGGA